MSRFFVDSSNVNDQSIDITNREDIRHLVKVLRLGAGDRIVISDSVEFEYQTEILDVEEGCVRARILDKQKFAREPELKITLFQGIPKQGKMETIIQKTVELGVHSIVPVFTDRTVVTDKGNFGKKIERWQKVSDEAVKQCQRGVIPEVKREMAFSQALIEMAAFELVLFPYENEAHTTMKDCLRNLDYQPKSAAVIIGPEGGFSDKEADLLKKAGARCVTLGKTILRTETAGIAAIAMVMYELEL